MSTSKLGATAPACPGRKRSRFYQSHVTSTAPSQDHMTVRLSSSCFVTAALLAATATSSALAVEASPADFTIFGAQRFWFATQNVKLLDAAVTLPSASAAPIIRTQFSEVTSSAVVPVTALGVRYGKALATLSIAPSTGFGSGALAAGGQIHRQEFDLSLGYAALPATTVSLIYKRGKVSPTVTESAHNLLGLSTGEGSGNALLLGISTSAALSGPFSMYANLAYGAGRWTSTEQVGQSSRFPSRYTVADFGVAWRTSGPTNITVQLGYRSQTLTLKDVELSTYTAAAQPQLLSTSRASSPSTTQGPVFSVGAAF